MWNVTRGLVLAGCVLLIGLDGAARADLLFGTAYPDTVTPNGSQEMTSNNVASAFQGGDMTITDIRFWSWEASPASFTGTISWAIYNDNNGTVGSLVVSGMTSDITRTPFSDVGYDNDVHVGSVAVAGGTHWLALHNGPLSNDTVAPNDQMRWAISILPNSFPPFYFPHTYDLANGGPWVIPPFAGRPLSFALYGQHGVTSVPEPSTLIVGGAGALLWLGYALRRQVG
jgi:hypothetical protein